MKTRTYTVHTIIVKGRNGQWYDHNFHGAFEDAAREEIAALKTAGVVDVALRYDTHNHKTGAVCGTRFERI